MVKVLCLGEMLVDEIAAEAGVAVEQVRAWTSLPGGAPANVACALARLGTDAGFVGCLGRDAGGDRLLQTLQERSVDITGVQVHASAPTRQVFVTRSEKGDRAFARFSGDADTVFADTQLDAALIPQQLFVDAAFLVLGTLCLAHDKSSRAVGRALKLAEENYVRVVVDVNWRPIFWSNPAQAPRLIQLLLKYADFLKISAEEADWLFHTTSPAAIAQAHNQLEGVLVTDGAKGCRYFLGDRQGKYPAFAIDAVDTTGAGDAFLAAFLHQLCQRPLVDLERPQAVDEILAYASAAGALAALGMGAIAPQPTDAEIRQFLAEKIQKG